MASPAPRRGGRGGTRPYDEEGERPQGFKLTEEEKAVLVECRRGSIARGLPLGVGSAVLLRWLIVQGRVPQHVKRWSWLYYGVSFTVSFFAGIRSYQKTCFKKIMSLKNSALADQIRKYEAKMKGGTSGTWDENETTDQSQPRTRRHSHHQPPTVTPSPPSQLRVDATEKPMYQAGNEEEQPPDAFGSSATHSTPGLQPSQEDQRISRSKTFDEIREENRRKQLEQNYPRPSGQRGRGNEERDRRQSRQQTGTGSAAPVHRNKYGDEVQDD